jgi:hypothetical protein
MTKADVTKLLIEEAILPQKWHETARWAARLLALPFLFVIGLSQLFSFFMPAISVTFLGEFFPLTAGMFFVPILFPLTIGAINFVWRINKEDKSNKAELEKETQRKDLISLYHTDFVVLFSFFFTIAFGNFLLPLVPLAINIILISLSLLATLAGLEGMFAYYRNTVISQFGCDPASQKSRIIDVCLGGLAFSASLLCILGSATFLAGLMMPMAVAVLAATAFFPLVAAAILHITRKIAFAYRAGRIDKAETHPVDSNVFSDTDSEAFQCGYLSAADYNTYFSSCFKLSLWFGKGSQDYYEGYRNYIDYNNK